MLKPGDTVMGMSLSHGGHLTHGSPVNLSGSFFRVVPYGVSPETEVIDYDEETGEPIDDEVIPGDDCSVFVEEETYERGVNAFLDIQIARIDSE